MTRISDSEIIHTAKEGLPSVVFSVISPLIAANPALSVALATAGSMYGAVLLYKQNSFNKQIKVILDNPEVFSEELVSSRVFTDGLIVHLDNYFKIRGDLKLEKARNIFFDFAVSNNKAAYPLERYDDVLLKISDAGIRFLGFIENKLPLLKEECMKKRATQNGADLSDEKVQKQYQKGYVDNKPLSYFIDNVYINDYVRQKINSKSENYLFEEDSLRTKLLQEVYLVVNELAQLGLLEKGVAMKPQGWDAVGQSEGYYNLTHFGKMFISVIKPEAENNLFKENIGS